MHEQNHNIPSSCHLNELYYKLLINHLIGHQSISNLILY